MRRHITRSTALVACLASLLMVLGATASQAGPTSKIEGSGSSWAANAINQWIADVTSSGLQVVFTSQGSAQGRKDFANNTTDFAVSDIGFRGVDPATGDQDTNQNRPYAYLPIVAGGTSFPYNLSFGGKQIRDLRLSGKTLAKIFTNQITSWGDPAIAADNNGRKMPSIPIIPLVHSEGSGSTAQLTTYFDTVYPSIWRPYQGRSGFTEYYPKRGGNMIAQNGSDQIINYATSSAANGVITYDEYSYALAKNFPVVKVQNASGYYTLPTQYNVAVALQKAQINNDKTSPNYLLQDLRQVFGYADPRTYPLSSYSYMIIPTGASDQRMSTAKRQALVDYLYYSACTGQKEMGPIGYSPLPINLVQASFDQTNKLKLADPKVDITKRDVSTCRNPTFVAGQPKRNFLAEIAPQPPACDKAGAGPCTGEASRVINANPTGGKAPVAATGSGQGAGGGSAGGGSAGGGSPGGGSAAGESAVPGGGIAAGPGTGADAGGGAGRTSTGPGLSRATGAVGDAQGSQTPTGGTTAATGATPNSKAAIDPTTGEVVALAGPLAGTDANQVGVPTDLPATAAVGQSVLGALTIGILMLAIAMPPLIGRTLSRRARGRL